VRNSLNASFYLDTVSTPTEVFSPTEPAEVSTPTKPTEVSTPTEPIEISTSTETTEATVTFNQPKSSQIKTKSTSSVTITTAEPSMFYR
jgi:hypothetical protein